jgi:hypothetical protein
MPIVIGSFRTTALSRCRPAAAHYGHAAGRRVLAGRLEDHQGPDLAVLHIVPFRPLGPAEADAIAAEGCRLLEFAAPAAAHDVRFTQAS